MYISVIILVAIIAGSFGCGVGLTLWVMFEREVE